MGTLQGAFFLSELEHHAVATLGNMTPIRRVVSLVVGSSTDDFMLYPDGTRWPSCVVIGID